MTINMSYIDVLRRELAHNALSNGSLYHWAAQSRLCLTVNCENCALAGLPSPMPLDTLVIMAGFGWGCSLKRRSYHAVSIHVADHRRA